MSELLSGQQLRTSHAKRSSMTKTQSHTHDRTGTDEHACVRTRYAPGQEAQHGVVARLHLRLPPGGAHLEHGAGAPRLNVQVVGGVVRQWRAAAGRRGGGGARHAAARGGPGAGGGCGGLLGLWCRRVAIAIKTKCQIDVEPGPDHMRSDFQEQRAAAGCPNTTQRPLPQPDPRLEPLGRRSRPAPSR